MTSIKVEARGEAFIIRKREYFQIPEKVWRENSTGKLSIELAFDSPMIRRKMLVFGLFNKRLLVATYLFMKGVHKVEGSGRANIKKAGKEAFSDTDSDTYEIGKLDNSNKLYELTGVPAKDVWVWNHWLTDEGTTYNQDEFLKNHLENGFVTVEVMTEISVNGEHVEDKRMKSKEAVVKDINNFCADERSSDFLVISEGEEIPCHRIMLCSRCPVIADGLAANMSEETSARWTVTDSNPGAVKDMLHFLYTGEIRGVKTRPTELLHLATFYRLAELEATCKEELVRRLTAGNAVKTLVNLDKFAADDGAVKEKVIGFIKKNAREVVEGEDWEVFLKNYGYLVTDIVKAIVK